MIFTTSWDDGRVQDMKLAALLEKYGATGTFYVCPPETHSQPALTSADITLLSSRHEIGAHTMTHPKLTRLSQSDAQREIAESKAWIESLTGVPCTMFCYPYGDENAAVRSLVQTVGFRGARTVEQLQFGLEDPYGMPTTLQIYPFPLRRKFTRWWHPLDPFARLRLFYPRMRELHLPFRSCTSWLQLALSLFMYAQRSNQPVFHLWGHSWEIEKYALWGSLEKFLKFVSTQEHIVYATNTDLL